MADTQTIRSGGVTYRVEGLDDLIRDFAKLDKGLAKELRKELRRVAEPVRAEVRKELAEKASSAQSRDGVTIRLRRGAQVSVENARRKTTGQRGDWGAIQQVRDYDVALAAKEGEILRGLEGFVDGLADGFNRGGRL